MNVRAKFIVQRVTKLRASQEAGSAGIGYDVQLTPVTGGSDEDKSFWRWTPSGEIRMSILNPAAGEQFEPGDTFYVDFTRVGRVE